MLATQYSTRKQKAETLVGENTFLYRNDVFIYTWSDPSQLGVVLVILLFKGCNPIRQFSVKQLCGLSPIALSAVNQTEL